MYDHNLHFALLGEKNEILLRCNASKDRIIIQWPDGTQYPLVENLLTNHAAILQELKQLNAAKKYIVSENDYGKILYNEFQDLKIYFGLLNTKCTQPSNHHSFDKIEIKIQMDCITISYPQLSADYHRQRITEKLSNNGVLISKNKYQELKRKIQNHEDLQTVFDCLHPFIEQKYPKLSTLKHFFRYQPRLNPRDLEDIQNYKDIIASIDENNNLHQPNEKDIEKLLSATRQLKGVIQRYQRNNSEFLEHAIHDLEHPPQNTESKIIHRFLGIMTVMYEESFMAEHISHIIKVLNLNPKHFENYLAQRQSSSATTLPVKKTSKHLPHPLPPLKKTVDVELPPAALASLFKISEDTHWFDDKEIQDIGNELLKSLSCPKEQFTFIHNAVDIKDHPTSLFQYAQEFSLSQQKYGFYALNLNDTHWVYVLLYRDEHNHVLAYFINSMSDKEYVDSCNRLQQQFNELHIPLHFIHLNIQKDGYNCGVWVLHFLQKSIEHLSSSPNIQIVNLLALIRKPINIKERRCYFKNLIQVSHPPIQSNIIEDFKALDELSKKINWMNAQQIQAWAIEKRQRRDKKGLSHHELLEAIAHIDQCYFLSSNGNRLRNTQKLAILAFLHNQDIGHLAQINTGEGKTIIVACVQALNVIFNHYKGHVFTSNSVLAEDGVNNNQSFFDILNISVAHNNADPNYCDGPRDCYSADIVYGTISNFQFDWLRHEFECQNTMGKDFNFDECWVMLDEIDSLLIDQGGNLAKLSTPFPGMSDLQHVYLTIWNELLHLDKAHENDPGTIYQLFIKGEAKQLIRNKIQQLIAQGHIAKHLESFIECQYPKWLASAFAAKYYYQKDVEYNIIHADGTTNIIPIDNQNTGVFLHNTVLSHGLHQFLQLKHGLPLGFESPTSSFVSNIGFVTKYSHKISGVTGTLGGDAEKELLNKKLKLQYSIIPPFKPKNFSLYEGLIVNDEEFLHPVALAILLELKDDIAQNKKKRAVLTICASIKDVNQLHEMLLLIAKEQGLPTPKIKLYRDESESKITEEALDLGDIVIATNLSGRGTDFHTTPALEANGGLHVIEAFLPSNQRVQDQGFGRTARQGKAGTGQLIIRSSETKYLGLYENIEIDDVLMARDNFEEARLEDIKSEKMLELSYQDGLFECFSQFYQQLKKQHQKDTDPKWRYILKDLKEKWAIWLIGNVETTVSVNDIEKHFETFKQQAQPIIQGEICHNPYYVIQLVQNYLSTSPSESRNRAKQELSRLVNSEQGFDSSHLNADLCYQLYMYFFEISIDEGGQLLQRFTQAIASIFNYPYSANHDYLIDAKSFLEKAKVGLQLKVDDLKGWLENTEGKPSRISFIVENAEYFKTEHNLCQYLQSKLNVYQLHLNNIQSLIEQTHLYQNGAILEKSEKHLLKFIDAKAPPEAASEDNPPKIIKTTVNELHAEGNSSIYELKPVHPVESKVLTNAKLQIGGGIATLGFAAYFPWTMSFLGPLAGAMISEGIMDILMSLMNHSEFNETEYHQGKIITYGIALATMGLGVIFKCTKIVTKVVDYLRNLAARLNNSTSLFSGVYKQVGRLLNRIADYLERMMFSVASVAEQKAILAKNEYQQNFKQLNKLNKIHAQKPLPILQQAKKHAFNGLKNGVENALINQLKNRAMAPFLKFVMQYLKPHLAKIIALEFKKHQSELRAYSKEHLKTAIQKLFDKSELNKNLILKKIHFGVIKKMNLGWPMNVALFALDNLINHQEINQFAESMSQKLLAHLSAFPKQASLLEEHVYKPIGDGLCDKLTDQLYNKIIALLQSYILDAPKYIKDGKQYFKDKEKEKEEIQALIDAAEFQSAISEPFESIEDNSDYQSIDSYASIPEPQNRGLGFFNNHRKSSVDYFYNYQPHGLNHLLKLRLQSYLGEHHSVVILPHVQFPYGDIQSQVRTINMNKEASYFCLPMLIPQDVNVNHWVGIVWKKDNQHIHGFYLDSENQDISDDIQQLFETIMENCFHQQSHHLENIKVQNQSYNNCGLELIENIALMITGDRKQEDDVLEFHQELVLQDTLIHQFKLSR